MHLLHSLLYMQNHVSTHSIASVETYAFKQHSLFWICCPDKFSHALQTACLYGTMQSSINGQVCAYLISARIFSRLLVSLSVSRDREAK